MICVSIKTINPVHRAFSKGKSTDNEVVCHFTESGEKENCEREAIPLNRVFVFNKVSDCYHVFSSIVYSKKGFSFSYTSSIRNLAPIDFLSANKTVSNFYSVACLT